MKSLFTVFTILALAGCGAIDATKSVPEKMDRMNDQVGKTNEAVHNQTLDVALSDMMKDQNTETLTPMPFGMLPAGKVFALEARADEIVQLVYVSLADVDKSQPDDSLRDPSNGQFPAAVVQRVDHQKLAKLMAAMVIVGLAPQPKIDEIIQTQIPNGRFEKTVYKILALRYAFIHDSLLENSLFTEDLRNHGEFEEAVKYADQLDLISSLPYTNKIIVTTHGMLNADNNITLQLDVGQTAETWRKIEGELDSVAQENKSAGLPSDLQSIRDHVRQRLNAQPTHSN